MLDSESRKLVADLPKTRVKRFPGFDPDIFSKLTQDDLDRMADDVGRVCCPDLVTSRPNPSHGSTSGPSIGRARGGTAISIYRSERLEQSRHSPKAAA
jgi:hypothetical protein